MYQEEFGKSINIKGLTKTMLGKANIEQTRKYIAQRIRAVRKDLEKSERHAAKSYGGYSEIRKIL